MVARTRSTVPPETGGLLDFIDAAPSPFHAVRAAADRLIGAGFSEVREAGEWPVVERGFVARGGSLVAWFIPSKAPPTTPFRLIGAHTDSPNLRIKPRPDRGAAGLRQLGVDVYGGVLLNSWLDRDLGLSGRVALRSDDGPRTQLFRIDRPLLRVPQLAVHLDREIYEKGLHLDRQIHVQPVWGIGAPDPGRFAALLAETVGAARDDVLGWDAMVHDLTPSTISGLDDEFISAPRLDNLCSCHVALSALLTRADWRPAEGPVAVVCLFDHEEVGSVSDRGAAGPLVATTLERLVVGRDGARDDLHRALASSVCLSADMAHATHPNYPERHEPDHPININGGPVIKSNVNLRYASDSESQAHFEMACDAAGVPYQWFVNRSNLPCGSTIGPITAAELGIATVDVGLAQLAMHSIRELAGAFDPEYMSAAMAHFLA